MERFTKRDCSLDSQIISEYLVDDKTPRIIGARNKSFEDQISDDINENPKVMS